MKLEFFGISSYLWEAEALAEAVEKAHQEIRLTKRDVFGNPKTQFQLV